MITATETKIKITGIAETKEVFVNGVLLDPAYSQKFRNHSPDGFNWGYGGSGPAQLALAIMLHSAIIYLKDRELALDGYQNFKWKVVANLPQGQNFEIEVNMSDYFKEVPNGEGE